VGESANELAAGGQVPAAICTVDLTMFAVSRAPTPASEPATERYIL